MNIQTAGPIGVCPLTVLLATPATAGTKFTFGKFDLDENKPDEFGIFTHFKAYVDLRWLSAFT